MYAGRPTYREFRDGARINLRRAGCFGIHGYHNVAMPTGTFVSDAQWAETLVAVSQFGANERKFVTFFSFALPFLIVAIMGVLGFVLKQLTAKAVLGLLIALVVSCAVNLVGSCLMICAQSRMTADLNSRIWDGRLRFSSGSIVDCQGAVLLIVNDGETGAPSLEQPLL